MKRLRLVVSSVRFDCASDSDRATGLLGYVSCLLNGELRLEGVTVRRTRTGRLALSFPSRQHQADLAAPGGGSANARTHPDENLDAIKAGLARFGQAEPLVVQKGTGRVIGGNGRLVVMKALGWTECDDHAVPLNLSGRITRQ